MEIIVYLLLLAVTGLFVGALGRLALPGRDPMSLVQTMLVGITATFIVGLLSMALFGAEGGSIILSVLVAMGIVWLIRRSRERSATTPVTDTRRF
ncbi:MAG TPA: hypothetical protein VD790_13435 [Thermoleophilaceae bacterium]|nr:hypothetical protein [Thermoleophilaceae bacterium]